MLHASTRYTLDLGEVGTLLFQSLQHEIDGFKPQGDRRKHLALGWVSEHTFLDAILGEISVKVDLRFVYEFEVGSHNNSCVSQTLVA